MNGPHKIAYMRHCASTRTFRCAIWAVLNAESSEDSEWLFERIDFDFYFCRFYSTEDPESLTSLDDYISRMKPDQDTILYLPGDSQEQILKSPILKKYVSRGYEVLLLADPIDEFCT